MITITLTISPVIDHITRFESIVNQMCANDRRKAHELGSCDHLEILVYLPVTTVCGAGIIKPGINLRAIQNLDANSVEFIIEPEEFI